MIESINIYKCRNVRTPARGHEGDAGLDFFVPEYSKDYLNDLIKCNVDKKNIGLDENGEFLSTSVLFRDDPDDSDNKFIIILPNGSILIPSGIKMAIPENYAGIFMNKSGVASKKKLLVGACVVDYGYTGEVHINLHNTSNNIIRIEYGEKITQMVIQPIITPTINNVYLETDLYGEETERGAGGFGSTDD